MTLTRLCLMAFLVPLLSACAGGPEYSTQDVDLEATPQSVVAELPTTKEQPVLWGGVVLNTKNLENRTQIEVLDYPLDSSQMPDRNANPRGRFLLEYYGFLEPTSYAAGRLITATGIVKRTVQGKVGGAEYVYPVLDAGDIHLWELDSERSGFSNINFGIGIGIGF